LWAFGAGYALEPALNFVSIFDSAVLIFERASRTEEKYSE
jgi:hypothetical protein